MAAKPKSDGQILIRVNGICKAFDFRKPEALTDLSAANELLAGLRQVVLAWTREKKPGKISRE